MELNEMMEKIWLVARMTRKIVKEDSVGTTYIHSTWNRMPVKPVELPAADTNEKRGQNSIWMDPRP
jgi:hypothetical protein